MSNQKMNLMLSEAVARMEVVICIAGMMTDIDCIPEPLQDFLSYEDEEAIKRCFPDAPPSVLACIGDTREFTGAFADWALQANKLGFLVQFATPVMTPWGDGANSYSWGHCNTGWVYGETLAQATKKGLQWVAKRRRAELARAKKS